MGKQKKTKLSLSQIAKDRFGYEELRPGQEAAIQSVLEGQDTLAVLPTGSGKSAIYQMAAFLIPGPTIVVSPLIALQRDQVRAIATQDVGEAAVVNSTISQTERQEAFENLEAGDLEFLFLAPEQFNHPETLDRLQTAKPTLFVVDEAHCVSAWGHDFRPDYLRLGSVVDALGHPPILALTATAAPPVRQEILERLGMRDSSVVVQGFDRPNIWLAAERFQDDAEKLEVLLDRVAQAQKPGIVYTATRKRTEEIAKLLQERGIQSGFYHAGMKKSEREQAEITFMQDEVEVLVATTAFGMGINKPNVRFVFHADISDSVDSYYQEIGRAGRDGELAKAVLFYNPSDLNLRRFLASGGQIQVEQVEQVAEAVQSQEQPISPVDLQEQVELSKTKLKMALNRLEDVGAIETLSTGEIASMETSLTVNEAAAEAIRAQERQQQFERARLEMMRGYAEVRDCRREYMLNYFGEKLGQHCGFCDNCKAGVIVENDGNEPYPANSRVIHKSWGEGTVMRYEGDKIVILFDQVGYKTLGIDITRLRGLLRRVE